MEEFLLSFYSFLPGVSEDLIQDLYELDASLLFVITIIMFLIGIGSAAFFYFNPFEFKKRFWAKTHWGYVLFSAGILDLAFTLGTCFQNQDDIPSSGFTEFLGFGVMTSLITILIYVIFSFFFKGIGNAVTRFTPI